VIDTLFIIYFVLLASMLGLALAYDARRRSRNKANARLLPDPTE
jgi:hypothetical protein